VVGQGQVEFIEALEEKRRALGVIMAQYAPGEFTFPEVSVQRTLIYRLVIEQMTGKQSRV